MENAKPIIRDEYCCPSTTRIMKTLVQEFDVTQAQVRIFENFFHLHPYTNLDLGNPFRNKETMELDFEKLLLKIFQVADLFENEIKDYFIASVLADGEQENIGGFKEIDFQTLKNSIKMKLDSLNESGTSSNTTGKGDQTEFTTARQILALYYLLEHAGLKMYDVNKTDLARFTQFLNGKEIGSSGIENTGIYKRWKEIYSKSDRKNRQDLEYIKAHFERLNLFEIVTKIQNDIDNA